MESEIKQLLINGNLLYISYAEFLAFENNEWIIKSVNKSAKKWETKINYKEDFYKALKYLLKK